MGVGCYCENYFTNEKQNEVAQTEQNLKENGNNNFNLFDNKKTLEKFESNSDS